MVKYCKQSVTTLNIDTEKLRTNSPDAVIEHCFETKTTRRLVRHATLCSPEQLDGAGYQASDLPLVKPQSPSQKARVKLE
jgi:hypothetical protein